MTGTKEAYEALDGLIRSVGTRPAAGALLVRGAPGSGKTEYAFHALMNGMDAFGNAEVMMTVSNRVMADRLADRAIHRIGASSQVRPVATLPALAYRVIAAVRYREGAAAPRLINGAEQDALLRTVIAAHLAHAVSGEICGTCRLLRSYFASDDWARTAGMEDAAGSPTRRTPHDAVTGVSGTTASMIERCVSAPLVAQLRDMLARMDELGVDGFREDEVLRSLASSRGPDVDHRADRLDVQWRLAFALRGEYRNAVEHAHPGQYRLDASRLLVEGAAALGGGNACESVPRMLVVDDFQDTTLAGLRFLEALHGVGTRLLLVGNPDESVQTFRGSYPEYVFERAVTGGIGAVPLQLDGIAGEREEGNPSYRQIVASRVSLSIASPREESEALPRRPGKLPRWRGTLPIASVPVDPADHSVRAALYHSPREELDDVVWHIKRARFDEGMTWNDMAVIAHDNATVRLYGERLRRDGVPVRYSSVTRPLKDEPFVQGLFALIELARLRRHGVERCTMGCRAAASFVRTRVAALMSCPVITTGAKAGQGSPARVEAVESAMNALSSLAPVVEQDVDADAEETGLRGLMREWEAFRAAWDGRATDAQTDGVVVDDTLLDTDADGSPMEFGVGAQYLMLAFDDASAPASHVLDMLSKVMGADPQARAMRRLWKLVDTVAHGLAGLQDDEPQFVLALAWDATGVARAWQTAALSNTAEGRAANDRLDVAMRLFQYAEGGSAGHDVVSFIAQVRSMRIEADSLAHVGPVEQAVSLTTPAGSMGRRWKRVWMPALQQDVWPNLAERGTLFGGEDLADIMLDGTRAQGASMGASGSTVDGRLASVLASEKKSLLVALTRVAGEGSSVTVSAVANDDMTPSDFLYGYLPERFDRENPVYTQAGTAVAGDDVPHGREPDASEDPDVEGWTDAADKSAATNESDASEDPDMADGQGTADTSAATNETDAVSATDGLGHRGGFHDKTDGPVAVAGRRFPDGYAGLDADPRGMVAAARITLADGSAQPAAVDDAVKALALLARHGVDSADPSNWAFLPAPDEDTDDAAHADPDTDVPVVSLSPSAVDGIWDCPVCWMLENRFAGPRPGAVAAGFGTLIHAVAQQGSEEGLDLPGAMPGMGRQERIDAVRSRLREIYGSLTGDAPAASTPQDRYAMLRKEETVEVILSSIAGYFVSSNEKDYLGANAKAGSMESIGELDHVDCEEEFRARFSISDILPAFNGLPGMTPVDEAQLAAFMGHLAGGWPEGMDEGLTVRLSGRIDRKETRIGPQGETRIRLIDYKTGAVPPARQIVNDLQLVCYQLGLAFPEHGGELGGMPIVEQSSLFHVAFKEAPAHSYAPEGLHQPALFTHGTLNAEPFTPRSHYTNPVGLLDMPVLCPQDNPLHAQGIPDDVWERFSSLNGTQALWALTMISRVFYAAAASRSRTITAHPTARHLDHCRMATVCPACAGEVDTVYETRLP